MYEFQRSLWVYKISRVLTVLYWFGARWTTCRIYIEHAWSIDNLHLPDHPMRVLRSTSHSILEANGTCERGEPQGETHWL